MRWLPLIVLVGCAPPRAVEVVFTGGGAEGEGGGEGEGEEGEGEEGEGEGEGEEGEGEEGEGEGEGDGAAEDRAARYVDAERSPLSRSVVERLRDLRAAHGELHDDVFAKVGDSNTVNVGFVTCFDGADVDLAGYDLDDSVEFFAGSYDRVSEAAVIGWSAFSPMQGDPSHLDVEVDAIDPAFAVVMFGTNDIELRNITRYADDMFVVVDRLLERGVIPLVSSVPPRDDDADDDAQVPRYALVARMVAESRQVPFLDLNRALRSLDDHGLGGDGIHLNTDPRGGCRFDVDGLTHGQNVRNLQTMQALDALRRRVVDGVDEFDDAGAARVGSWLPDDPVIVDVLPFTGEGNTALSSSKRFDSYDCAPSTNEGGAEAYARITLTEAKTLHALVFDQGAVDIDVHVVDEDGHCVVRSDKEAVADLDAGAYDVVFDTFGGDEHAGAFQTVLYLE